MNRPLQKLGALLAGACLLFSACAEGGVQPDASSSGNEPAKGRYVEEVYSWPEGVNLAASIQARADGTLEIVGSPSEGTVSGPWEIHVSADGGRSWTKKDTPWLSAFDAAALDGVSYDGEGNLYLLSVTYPPEFEEMLLKAMETGEIPAPEEYPPYLLHRITPEGQVEELPMEWSVSEDGRVNVYGFLCAGENQVVVNHFDRYVLYDLTTGQPVHTFLTAGSDPVVYGDTLAVAGDTGIEQYDLKTGETLEVIPFDEAAGGSASLAVSGDQKALYRCNGRGVYRYVLGGSVWERLIDGELTSLNMPSVYIGSLIPKEDGDFLVLTSDEGAYVPLNFSFDASAPLAPTRELNVYSLYENNTVRQAIGLMQRAYPDVYVRYTVAVDEQSAVQVSDAIRALNTELLAGKGPDVLLLDGLPIDSYVEKGILADLSQTVGEAQGDLLANITETYRKDGALYAVPTRFLVPEMWGSEDFIAKAADLESMADWVEAAHAENPGQRQLYRMQPAELIEDFYYTCAPAWRAEDGSIRPEEFTAFLTDIKRLADAVSEPDLSVLGEWGEYMNFELPFGFLGGGGGSIYWANGLVNAVYGLSGSMMDYCGPDAAAGYLGGGGFALMAGQAKGVYVPSGILGLNSHAAQPEEGAEFIRTALSQAVQRHDFEDGYPVHQGALAENAKNPYVEGDDGMQAPVFEDGEMKVLFILWPEESFMEGILQLLPTLDTPCTMDPVLLEMIVEETRDYFTGSISVEQAVSAVVERAQAYLAE
ncbi:MAG: hypothetical protein HFG26_12380 [Provencibacterium sp.]|nr:hypothetical protein [Provencibacterium sp.]